MRNHQRYQVIYVEYDHDNIGKFSKDERQRKEETKQSNEQPYLLSFDYRKGAETKSFCW
jgi:hypothetical protein